MKTLTCLNSRRADRTGERTGGAIAGRRSWIVAAPSLMLLAGCAAVSPGGRQSPGVELPGFAPPRVRLGDRWTYREVNLYNRLVLSTVDVSVTNASPLVCRVGRTRLDSAVGEIERRKAVIEERYSDPWSIVEEPTYDLPMRFEAPMPLLPPVFSVGSYRVDRTRYTVDGYSGRYEWEQRLRAVAAERIRTPAGIHDCLRVRRDIAFDYPDPFRRSSRRVDELWYAPAVNRWVRREWSGDYQHDNAMDPPGTRLREDWVAWELLSHVAAGTASG